MSLVLIFFICLMLAGFVSFGLSVLSAIFFDFGSDRWAGLSCVAIGLGFVGAVINGLVWAVKHIQVTP